MKRSVIAAVMLCAALVATGCTPGRYSQYGRSQRTVPDSLSTMKSQDVIALSKAGISDSLIISMMNASGSWFNLKTQDVIDLKNAGVSDNVINAMVNAKAPMADNRSSDGRGYAYYYPPYYWNAAYDWYYPFGYYPSWYFGFNYYRPAYYHGYAFPHRTYYGTSWGGRSYGRTGGRHR